MNIPHEFSRPVRIGSGSFSTVCRVYQQELERYVALKILPFSKGKMNTAIDQEMRILASLQLPCVPHIYDVKRMRKQIVLVMEWIRGIPLSLLFKQFLTAECKMSIATSIVKNLELLHVNQVVHGDLKPENVLVTSDLRVFFIDFGFSLLQNASHHALGMIQGTPKFMAPELWSCDSDAINYKKVDLYALGILLRELLGDTLPTIAYDLTATDPGRRPSDAVVFEKIWHDKIKGQAACEVSDGVVAAVVQEYTARMLLKGAHELYAKGKCEDAYSLLTESLEIWPDQNEALEFLQQKYSSPVNKSSKRRMAFTAFITVAMLLSIALAYFAGRQDSISGSLGRFNIVSEDAQMVSLAKLSRSNQIGTMPPVALRETAGGMNLTGMICINRNVEDKGTLIIDGTPITDWEKRFITIQLKIGSHRLEWYDSTSRRRFGEITELLPFENKNISLRRFIDGKRK
jgi:serine/threonine protein kinase